MQNFETLGQYHDHLASVVLSAPDHFYDVRLGGLAANQQQLLATAFDRIRGGFHFIQKKLKDERLERICQELIEMSFEAYSQGDKKSGAHVLQEFRGMVWPMWATRAKYAVEAEQRAFGEIELYADVVVSPYPYEGTSADLSLDQAKLLALAERWTRDYQAQRRDFKCFSWVTTPDGAIWRTSVEPKEDEHPALKPLQKGWGFKRLRELGRSGQIQSCVLMEIVGPLGDGLVGYDLEERGRPRVSARQLFKREADAIRYDQMRFHLEDAQFFPAD